VLKNIKYYFFYLIYLSIFVIVLAEIIFRILPTQNLFTLQKVDSKSTIIRYEPNKKVKFSLGWNFYQTSKKETNNYGFVSSKDYIKNGEPNVMVIGDSYVEAMQISHKKTISETIEQNNAGLNVYSIGISEVPLSQYIKFIEFAEKEFNPKEYLIVVVGNDFDESLCSYKQKQGTYCFDENFKLQLISFPGYSKKRRLGRNSAFVRYIILNLKIDWRNLISKLGMKDDGLSDRPEYAGNTEKNKNKEIEILSLRAIDQFLSQVSSITKNKKVTIIVDADRNDIYTGLRTTDSYFYKMRAHLIEKAKITEVGIVDLRPIFENHFKEFGQSFNFPTDGHWNELGHELAAKAYLNLKKNNLN